MGLINVLSFLELTKVNQKLNDIHQQNEINEKNKEYLETTKSLTKLFQDLVNHNNNMQLVDLSETTRINQFINNEFNTIKFDKPKRNILATIFLLLIGALTLYWYKISYVGFLFGASAAFFAINLFYFILNEIKLYKYNKHTKNYESYLIILKSSYPNLSAYGIYLKWYIYSKTIDIKNILSKNCNADLNETMKTIYKIFEVESKNNDFIKYELDLLANFNGDLIEKYNRIDDSEINAYQNPTIKNKINIENLMNAEAFIKSLNENFSIIIMPNGLIRQGIYDISQMTDELTEVTFTIKDQRTGKTMIFDNDKFYGNEISEITEEEKEKILNYFIKHED